MATEAPQIPQSQQRPPLWRNATFLKWSAQVVVAAGVFFLLYLMISQALDNLDALGLGFNFDFLNRPVNFPISEGISTDPTTAFDALKTGIVNMLRVTASGIPAATVLGVLIGIARLSSNWLVSRVATGYVEFFRNVPLLVQIIFWRVFVQETFPDLSLDAGPLGGDLVTENVRQGYLFVSNKGISLAWLFPSDGFWQWVAFIVAGLIASRYVYKWRMRIKDETGAETYAISWTLGTILAFAVVGWFAHPIMGFLGPIFGAISSLIGALPVWLVQVILAGLAVAGAGLFIWRFLESRRTPAGLAKLTDDDVFRIGFAAVVGLVGVALAFLFPGISRTLIDWGERFFAFLDSKFEFMGREGSPLNFSRPTVVQPGNFANYGPTGLTMTLPFFAVWTGVTLYTAAFIAEIVRGGILAVPKGQTEAGLAMGLKRSQLLRFVVLPQAFRIILPPLGNQYLNLAKNTSLAIAVAYPDIVAVGNTIFNQTGRSVEVIVIWMGFYLIVSLILSAIVNYFNRRMALVER